MRCATLLLLALALAGCIRQIHTETGPVDQQRLAAWAEDLTGPQVFAAWLEAVHTQSNSAALLQAYATAADEKMVEYLASQPRGALVAKLDSLARRTNRHHYTKEQLEQALRLKDARAVDRKKPSE